MFRNQTTIIKEFRRLHRRGLPLYRRAIRRTHPGLESAAVQCFGSYGQAIDAAGLDYSKVRKQERGRWNRQSVIAEFRRLRAAGEPLNHAAVERNRPDLAIAAYRYFRNYRAAIKAAGINYLDVRVRPKRIWSRTRILAGLRQFRKERQPLHSKHVRRTRSGLHWAAIRMFGTYAAAAKAAGIPAAEICPPPYRIWSPERVASELQRMKRANETMAPSHVQRCRPSFYATCRKRFGTFRTALEAAGIRYDSVAQIKEPALERPVIVEQLRALYHECADLRYVAVAEAHPRLLNSARARFGSYRLAVEAAGLDYPPVTPLRHWTATLVLQTLRDMDRRRCDLRYRTLKQRNIPLFEAARHYFGTYLEAVRAAGIDYSGMVSRMLRRARRAA